MRAGAFPLFSTGASRPQTPRPGSAEKVFEKCHTIIVETGKVEFSMM
jgi:uncharacterized protein YbaP (TraB family)